MPLDTAHLTAIVSLLIALSIATERLVEIVKGLVPPLSWTYRRPWMEEGRKCLVQGLAVGAGVVTAWLAQDSIPVDFVGGTHSRSGLFVLGLLASGGSGFWNSILTYLVQLKNIKSAQAAAITANPTTTPSATTETPATTG